MSNEAIVKAYSFNKTYCEKLLATSEKAYANGLVMLAIRLKIQAENHEKFVGFVHIMNNMSKKFN